MKKTQLHQALLFVVTILVTACSSATDCHKDEACACNVAGNCEWNCVDEGCAFTVSGAGDTTLTCPEGGCSLVASGAGDVSFDCAGGNCTANSSASGNITLTCSGGGCSTTCAGEGNCQTTQCPSCTCNETAITASCSIQ